MKNNQVIIKKLQEIPSVGPELARKLYLLGITSVADLKNKSPEKLYQQLCKLYNTHIDKCVLYVFRCAVYYASHTTHDKQKLKWWYWKD